MEYKYTVYTDDEKIAEVWQENRSRKIKEPVTIEIKVELDRTQYEKVIKKYKTPLGNKILKLFE